LGDHENREPLQQCSGSLFIRPAVALTLAFLAACAVALPVDAIPSTTAPDQPYRINVVLTDGTVKIERDRFTARDGTTRYPRGALIDFIIKNEGKQAHTARLKLLSQHYFSSFEVRQDAIPVGKTPIRPGQVRQLAINFYFRGSFALQLMAGARPRASARIVIF
jgi:hypothetical protein